MPDPLDAAVKAVWDMLVDKEILMPPANVRAALAPHWPAEPTVAVTEAGMVRGARAIQTPAMSEGDGVALFTTALRASGVGAVPSKSNLTTLIESNLKWSPIRGCAEVWPQDVAKLVDAVLDATTKGGQRD